MFKGLTVFQIVVIVSFLAAAIIAVILFATGFGIGGGKTTHDVLIWGTVDEDIMTTLLFELEEQDKAFSEIRYIEKNPRTYIDDFVNALAAGTGPDLFLLGQEAIVSQEDKILTVPYSAVSERQFRNTFIQVGELFLTEEGIIGFPFLVDPLVMYWNRDIFQAEGVANPPLFWDELFVLAPRITERDQASNIVRSFVALGEFRNVVHAKEILSSLILQTGNPIVTQEDGRIRSVLDQDFDFTEPSAVSALRFFTEFSNPIKSVYSWNRALPDSKQSFIAGDLALYIGFASELSEIRQLNPNLNFDVVELPQSREAAAKVTFGNLEAFVIPRTTRNIDSALATAVALAGNPIISRLSMLTNLPPVRRDLLRTPPTDAYAAAFYNAALSARSWLDPDDSETNAIFQRMIESTISGRARLSDGVRDASKELDNLLVR